MAIRSPNPTHKATLADAAENLDECLTGKLYGVHTEVLDKWTRTGVPMHATSVGYLFAVALRYRAAYELTGDPLPTTSKDSA